MYFILKNWGRETIWFFFVVFCFWSKLSFNSTCYDDGPAGIKLNRGPVAQDQYKSAWAPENCRTVAQMTTDILIISCAKSVSAGPQEFLLGY